MYATDGKVSHVARRVKVTARFTFLPQGGCNGYSHVNDRGYYDLQEAPTLIVFWCLIRSPPLSLRGLGVMLWIFINVFLSAAAGLSLRQ